MAYYRISVYEYKRLVELELAQLGSPAPLEDNEHRLLYEHYKARIPAQNSAIIVKGNRMAAARKAAGEAE